MVVLNKLALESAQSIFGVDIVKDAYVENPHHFDAGNDIIDEDGMDLQSISIVVEFINGSKVRVWATQAGGVEKVLKAEENNL